MNKLLYGLKSEVIEKISSVFSSYADIKKVILYGSRAKGTYRNGSDIDLTIFGENIGLSLLQKIENGIDDLLLPYTVDISIYKQINNSDLIDHINRVGIEFFVKR